MSNLLKELSNCRKRWLQAKAKNDKIMMGLWLRVGLSLKRQIAEKFGKNFGK